MGSIVSKEEVTVIREDFQINSSLSDYDEALERINKCIENNNSNLILSGLNLSEKFPALPEHISILIISGCNLTKLDDTIINHKNLKDLDCSNNQIRKIAKLPISLKHLYCRDNQITNVSNLPNTLETINCSYNVLTDIDNLPNRLETLICSHNQLTELPTFPDTLKILYCDNNALTFLNMENTLINRVNCSYNKLTGIKFSKSLRFIDCSHNELTSLPEITEEMKYLYVNCSYNKITKVPKNYNDIELYHNSIEKIHKSQYDILPYMGKNPVFEKLTDIKYKSFENSKLQIHTFEGKKFTTLTLPKGTVLFRSLKDSKDFIEGFIGFKTNNQYIINPDFEHYFLTHPFIRNHGDAAAIYVLNNDVTVILGLIPSKYYSKDNIQENFGQSVESRKYESKIFDSSRPDYNDYWIESLKETFMEEYPKIMGWFAINMDDFTKPYGNYQSKEDSNFIEYSKYVVYYENSKGISTRPELAIYPFKNRVDVDVITEPENANYEYVKSNIDKYNYRTIAMIDFNTGFEEYKNVIDKLLSPSGYNNGEMTMHMTVNQNNGLYILAEFATEETLSECLPISKKKKV